MNTEEKILNYMDGTLSEGESGELLHSLSVSPEKRVVLEQHIKLRELTAIAQKPFAVPQELESEMADRFAAIAAYNREMAGGAMLVKDSPSFIGRMAASVAAFVAQYPLRTGFAVAAASVIGYFALANSPAKKADVASVKQDQVQTAQNIPQSGSASSSSKSGSAESKMENTSDNGMNKSSISDKTYKSYKTNSKNNTNSSSEKITHQKQSSPPEETTPTKQNIADNPGNATPPSNEKKSVDNNSINNKITETPKKDDTPKAIAENNQKTDLPPQKKTDMPSDANVGNHGENPFKNREDNSTSGTLAVRLYAGYGQSFVNIHQNDVKLANHTEAIPVAGIDYIGNPYISVGIEVGSAAISQLVTQSSLQSGAGDIPISRMVTSNSVSSNSQFYTRLMGRWTINPYDEWRFELSGGAGLAFASGREPLISTSLLLGHDIKGGLAFSFGIALSGTWASANAQSSVASVSSSEDPIGYVTVNRASATLFTPSASFRVGVKYKLW